MLYSVINALTGEELFSTNYYMLALAFQEKHDNSLYPLTRIVEMEVAV